MAVVQQLSDQTSTSPPPILSNQDAILVPDSASASRPDAFHVSVSEPRNDGPIQRSVPVPITADRDVVSEQNHELSDDLHTQRLAMMLDGEMPVNELHDHQNEAIEMESERIAWLLGDDGLESSTSTEFLLQDKNCTTTSDSRLRVESAVTHDAAADVMIQTTADDGALVDEAVEELVGATSPLANLPTESDVSALIDLLRTSPSSSKPISHASTISLNDILDDDPDLEATFDLDRSLCSLVDGYSVDDAGKLASSETAAGPDGQSTRKSNEKATTFRNTDHEGFGFGLSSFDTDRIGEDVGKQLTASNGDIQVDEDTDKDCKYVDVRVESEERAEIALESSIVNNNAPTGSLAYDIGHHDDVSRTVVNLNEKLADLSMQSPTLSEVPPRSNDAVENPDKHKVVEAVDTCCADDGDSTCRRVKHVDHDVVDGQSPMNSTPSTRQTELDSHQSERSECRVSDIVTGRPCPTVETGNSKIQPVLRRKSCDWNIGSEVPKSKVEVGQDNVTALTAYFEEVHADQCPGCTVCLTGTVQRPFVIQRRSSLPVGTCTCFTSPAEFTGHHQCNASRLVATKLTAPEPVSDTGLTQASNSLPRSFLQTTKPSPKELKQNDTSGFRNSLQSVTVTEDERDSVAQTSNVVTSTTSRRVVSLPDMSAGSTPTSRDEQRRAKFRFRLAKVRSHSLRSFNDLTASGITKRSRPFEPVANRPSLQHAQQSTHEVNNIDELAAVRKSTVSKSFETAAADHPSRRSLTDRLQSVDKVAGVETAAHVSLDNLLAELCTPVTGRKEHSSSLTPDVIRKYRIEPRRKTRSPARPPPPPARHGCRPVGRQSGSDDVVSKQKHSGLEERIDEMLFDADRRWSDDEWHRRVGLRRIIPRTTAPVPASSADFSCPYAAQPVSNR